MFQNVLFYVLSDDTERAKQIIYKNGANETYDIIFPGYGDISVPGSKFI